MEISSFVWNKTNIEHIASHHVTPEEVEEACLEKPLILRASRRYVRWKNR